MLTLLVYLMCHVEFSVRKLLKPHLVLELVLVHVFIKKTTTDFHISTRPASLNTCLQGGWMIRMLMIIN